MEKLTGGEKKLRDKYGRPYYLQRLSLYQRYPRTCLVTASTLTFCFVFSVPIYQALFTKPEDLGPYDLWWPSEKQKGKRQVDVWRERTARDRAEAAAAKANKS